MHEYNESRKTKKLNKNIFVVYLVLLADCRYYSSVLLAIWVGLFPMLISTNVILSIMVNCFNFNNIVKLEHNTILPANWN